MKHASLAWATVTALVLMAGLVIAIIVLYSFIADSFVLGLAGAVISVGWTAYQFRKLKEHEADARLFSAKANIYEDLALLIRDLLVAQTDENDPDRMIKWMSKLYLTMRIDLGHRDKGDAALRIALGHILPDDRKRFLYG